MNKIEHQNEHFEQIAEKYYKARQGEKHLLYKRLLLGYMLSNLKIKLEKDRKMAVLEPMCGYGEGRDIIRRFVAKDIDYEGFDYNDTLIEKVKMENPNINIYKQDVTQFKTEKKYDIVILIGGLHHVHDYAGDVVRNIGSVLNPGGVFINFEPTHNNAFVALARLAVYKINSFFDDETEHDFGLREINKMYQDAGLQIYKQFYPGLLGYIFWYNPDAFPLLNIGTKGMVKALFKFEKPLISGLFGKVMSFTTFTVLKKNN